MQDITIDLTKEPDLKADTADKEPGDSITLHTTIKSMDEQTLVLTTGEFGVDDAPTNDATESNPGSISDEGGGGLGMGGFIGSGGHGGGGHGGGGRR